MIIDLINEKIKEAMINKDASTRDCLRLVKIKAQAIAKENKSEIITDDMAIKALKKELKELNQTKESISANTLNSDIYNETIKKIKIVSSFLPAEISDEELFLRIKEILVKLPNDTNFGLKMKAVMGELSDVDGKRVSRIIKNI